MYENIQGHFKLFLLLLRVDKKENKSWRNVTTTVNYIVCKIKNRFKTV